VVLAVAAEEVGVGIGIGICHSGLRSGPMERGADWCVTAMEGETCYIILGAAVTGQVLSSPLQRIARWSVPSLSFYSRERMLGVEWYNQ